MAIDIETETLITLTQAANRVPGEKVHPMTVRRWHRVGVRGIKLETVVVAGRRWTSHAALFRFLKRRADADVQPGVTTPRTERDAKSPTRALVLPETIALHGELGMPRPPRRRGA